MTAEPLRETAAVYWRPRVDDRRLTRRGRIWTLTTVAHAIPYGIASGVLLALEPLSAPVCAILLAHAWAVPALYAKRGANVLKPRPRAAAGPEQTAGLVAGLRAANPELIVAIDEEGGAVTRLEAATGSSWPGNLALGVVDDPALTERVAREIGRMVAAAGITLDYAPVADVNTDPDNPVRTTSLSRGMSMSMFLRLCSRAPRTLIRS